jgi:hypothetical protein
MSVVRWARDGKAVSQQARTHPGSRIINEEMPTSAENSYNRIDYQHPAMMDISCHFIRK